MISRIEGELVSVGEGRVEVQSGAITYEILVPAADLQRLGASIGQPVTFCTLHFMENHGQGAAYMPRLVGFRSLEDREFFELFTTVKGIGARKALRALQMPFGTIAEAIAARDLGVLQTLPEIGKRTAETIVAELHGKVDRFVELKPWGIAAGQAADDGEPAIVRDAVSVLVQLGEPRLAARKLVDRAIRSDSSISTADALVAAAYRLMER
jgi:Holliday junction DNA helicase RuvA